MIARCTQLKWTIASDNGLLGIGIAGVGSRFWLIFNVAEVSGHFCIERCLDADFFSR